MDLEEAKNKIGNREDVQGKAEKVGREIWLEKGNRKCLQMGGNCRFRCAVNEHQMEEKYFLPTAVEQTTS